MKSPTSVKKVTLMIASAILMIGATTGFHFALMANEAERS
jgi:hypothetical protein